MWYFCLIPEIIIRQQHSREGEGVLRWPWSHDLSSTRTMIRLLRSWIRRCTMIIFARWFQTSNKFNRKKVKRQPENLNNGQLLSECEFVQRIASSSLSRGRKRKMHHWSNPWYHFITYSKVIDLFCNLCFIRFVLLVETTVTHVYSCSKACRSSVFINLLMLFSVKMPPKIVLYRNIPWQRKYLAATTLGNHSNFSNFWFLYHFGISKPFALFAQKT